MSDKKSGYSNPILERIAEIFKDGGMDSDSKKEELKTLLIGKCPKKTKMEDFVKETFEDFVSDALDQDTEMKTAVSMKTKIVMNLWTENSEGINDENFLSMRETMQLVLSELQEQ